MSGAHSTGIVELEDTAHLSSIATMGHDLRPCGAAPVLDRPSCPTSPPTPPQPLFSTLISRPFASRRRFLSDFLPTSPTTTATSHRHNGPRQGSQQGQVLGHPPNLQRAQEPAHHHLATQPHLYRKVRLLASFSSCPIGSPAQESTLADLCPLPLNLQQPRLGARYCR